MVRARFMATAGSWPIARHQFHIEPSRSCANGRHARSLWRPTTWTASPWSRLARLVALELPDHGGAGQQLELRLEPNNSGRQVFDLYLLRLQRIGLARHLVLELDHRGQGAPHALGDTHQAAFRALRLAL